MKRSWWLIIVAVVLAAAGFALRASNNSHAGKLATAVVASDAAGADPTPQVASLKAYVHGHTGTHASFTLQNAYNKAVAAAQSAAQIQATNSQIYAAAQAACSGKADSITQANCNAAYLQQHLVALPASAPTTAPLLSAYQYNLKSPWWTPDLAGFLLAAALVSLVVGGVGFVKRRRL